MASLSLLASASCFPLLLQPAFAAEAAQDSQEPAAPAEEAPEASEIIVTGTRVARSGFQAPTPTLVISGQDLTAGGRTNIGQVLADLPQYTATSTPTTNVANVTIGTNAANLRNLGIQRTLVLINGARPIPTNTSAGLVAFDLNMVPDALVKRIDVVTGGASASWGSDAVSGVINIVLDDELKGLRLNAQYGNTTEGLGGREWKGDIAYGTDFADGRGHVMAAFGYNDVGGIFPRTATVPGRFQTIANPAFTPTNGQPQAILAFDVKSSNAARGGLITSGPLRGTVFGPNGTTSAFQFGSLVGPSLMAGGDSRAFSNNDTVALSAPFKRWNGYVRATYDLADTLTMSADFLYGDSASEADTFPDNAFGNITIRRTNAFLPAAVRTALTNATQTTFLLGRVNTDFGLMRERLDVTTKMAKVGFDGKFGQGWTWDAFYQYGQTDRTVIWGNQRIAARFANSVDAVISPTTGLPICAIALTDPTTNCVPVNLFGEGSPSRAALDYFMGSGRLDMRLTQHEAGVNVRGDLFNLWDEPVSIAAGVGYRRQTIDSVADPITVARGFAFFNIGRIVPGNDEVFEGYAEVVVPALRNVPLFKSLDLNFAARVSDYQNSGTVPSWKVGLTNLVIDGLTVRATISRDIRAPNVAELFSLRTTQLTSVVDPATNIQSNVTLFGGGNTGLDPEKADTITAGFVLRPVAIPGLGFSVDYYRINLKEAISQLGAQAIVNQCAAGSASSCGQITRVNGVITEVLATFFNIASFKTSGIDAELSYRTGLDSIGVPGQIDTRVLVSRVDRFEQNTGAAIIRLAGDITNGIPKWRGIGSINYTLDDFRLSARMRYVGGGALTRQLNTGVEVPSITYFDLGGQWTLPGTSGVTLFGDISNIGNTLRARNQNPTHYDVVGRRFQVGVRATF